MVRGKEIPVSRIATPKLVISLIYPFMEVEAKASPSFLVKCGLEGGLEGTTDGEVFSKYTDFYFSPGSGDLRGVRGAGLWTSLSWSVAALGTGRRHSDE